jgi:WD40 repeat protein
LIAALTGNHSGAEAANIIVQGPGGFGKTALAIDACHRPETVGAFPDGILWTTLGRAPNLAAILADLHVQAAGSVPTVAGIEAIAKATARALEARRCLVVLDDVWRDEDLQCLLQLTFPRFLVTSRVTNLVDPSGQEGWAEVLVDEMRPAEASTLLERGLQVDETNRPALVELADRLGCWPLLLDLAGARLREEHRTRHGNLTASIQRVVTLFEQRGVLGFDRRDSTARNAAVANSIKEGLTFASDASRRETGNEASPGVADRAAELAIFPEDMAVPVRVLADLWQMQELDIEEDVLRILANLRIVEWDRQNSTVQLHDLVRRALVTFLGADRAAAHSRLLLAWGDLHLLPHDYAWQRVCWHLREANRREDLRTLLTDLTWLEAKIRHAGLIALLQDIDLLSDDNDVGWMKAALLLSTATVSVRPELLAQQLESRLPPSVWQHLQISGASTTAGRLRSRRRTIAQVGGPVTRLFSLGNRIISDIATLNRTHLLLAAPEEGLITLNIENSNVDAFCRTVRAPSAIAVGDDEGRLVAYAVRDDTAIHIITKGSEPRVIPGADERVRSIRFCGNSRALVTEGNKGTIQFRDSDTGRLLHSLPPVEGSEQLVCGSHRSNIVALVQYRVHDETAQPVMKLLDVQRFLEVGVVELPIRHVSQVAASPSGRLAACTHSSLFAMGVSVVDVQSRRLLGVLVAEAGPKINGISCVAFSSDERLVMAGTTSGELLVWDNQTTELLNRIDAHHNSTAFVGQHGSHIVTAGRSSSGSPYSTGSNDCNVKVWAGGLEALPSATSDAAVMERHRSDVSAMDISTDGSFVATGSYDRTVALWDVAGMRTRRTFRVRGVVRAVSLNHSATVYAALSNYLMDSGVVNVWSLINGEPLCEIETTDLGQSMAVTPNGQYVLVATCATLDVHAVSDGSRTRSIAIGNWNPDHFHTGALSFCADGVVALGYKNGVVRWWNLSAGQELLEIKAHESAVTRLSVSEGSGILVSLGSESEVTLWHAGTGAAAGALATTGLNVVTLAAAKNKGLVLTGSSDGTARVWGLDSRREVATFAVDSPLKACAISGDGAGVFLGDVSGVVHFFELEGV